MKHEHDDRAAAGNHCAEQNDSPCSMHIVAQTTALPSRGLEPHDSRGTGVRSLIRRSAAPPDTRPKYRLGQPNADGFRYGPQRFVSSPKVPETNLPRRIPGEANGADAGFDVLDAKDDLVSWHTCIVDACDSLRALKGPGKIVRCSDRALLKHRLPYKGRL